MPQPSGYTPATNFAEEEADQVGGRSSVRTAALDAELAAIELTLDGLCTNLALIQRDDGEIRDRMVKIHTLATDVITLIGSGSFTINDPVAWATGINYAARSIVTSGTGTYVAVSTHLSAALFATDLAAGKWVALFDTDVYAASGVTFTPAGTIIATNVQAALEELDASVVHLGEEAVISRNIVRGGDFSVSPRAIGTPGTFTADGNPHQLVDGWQIRFSGMSGQLSGSISTSAPSVAQAGRLVTGSLLLDCGTADATIGVADYLVLEQEISGRDILALAQRDGTLSFWHAHSQTGTHCVALRNGAKDRSLVLEYTQLVADAWELAELAVPASPSAGTWDYDDGIGLTLSFVLAAGTNYDVAAGAWQAGNFLRGLAAPNNVVDSTANNFRLALVQLEAGDRSAFQSKSYEEEILSHGHIGRPMNAVIGGDFSINPWQRGTSFVAAANGTYTADRWVYRKSGAMVHTVSKEANSPETVGGLRWLDYTADCLLVDCTTADAAIAAADFCCVSQRIEGNQWRHFAGRTVTLGFWHAHTKVGIYCVALNSNSNVRGFVAEYQQLVADEWEFSEIVIPANYTVDRQPELFVTAAPTAIAASLDFVIAAGTNYHHAPAGEWSITGVERLSTANQVNGCDNVANNFRIALVQIEPGPRFTRYHQRTPVEELALCQRYYQKSFPLATAPVQNVGNVVGAASWRVSVGGAGGDGGAQIMLPVAMRAIPTLTFFNPNNTNNNWRNINLSIDSGTGAAENTSEKSFFIRNAQVAGDTVGDQDAIHWTAEAEL
jgi:hypothetical protein